MSGDKLSKRKFIEDMILNIIAAGIPVAVLNLIIYPLVAGKVGAVAYGTMTTSIGILHFSNGIWGSSVAHTRLLYQGQEDKKDIFLTVLVGQMILGSIFSFGILCLTGCIVSKGQAAILVVSGCFLMANSYLVIEYRLRLSYVKILLNNLSGCIGYIVGYLIFIVMGFRHWEMIFALGAGASFFFGILTTSIWKGKISRNPETFQTAKKSAVLVSTSAISGTSTYLDKLVIYPVLGAESMAYYQAAGVLAKIIPLVASAISNVMLSYLIKIVRISKKWILVIITLFFGIGVVGVLVCNMVIPYVVQFLYPSFYEECRALIPYTNIVAMFQMCYSFLFPFSLRYAKRTAQFLIQFGRLIPYVAGCFLLIPSYGLIGFCYATIVSQVIQIGIIVHIVLKSSMEGYSESV